MSALRASLALVVVALAFGAPVSRAASIPSRPWATINVCDTKGHPDALGVRGSMPGIGTQRTHLYLRIQVEFQGSDGSWQTLGASGDSGWLDAGKTLLRSQQTGRTFTITPPDKGQPAFVLRAQVRFEWRRGRRVLKRAHAATTGGHKHVMGADPAGFSAATCTIA